MSRDGPGCTFLLFRTASFQVKKYEAWRSRNKYESYFRHNYLNVQVYTLGISFLEAVITVQ